MRCRSVFRELFFTYLLLLIFWLTFRFPTLKSGNYGGILNVHMLCFSALCAKYRHYFGQAFAALCDKVNT